MTQLKPNRRSFLISASIGVTASLTGCVADETTRVSSAANTPVDPSVAAKPLPALIQEATTAARLVQPSRAPIIGPFYSRISYAPVWYDGQTWTPKAQTAFNTLINADQDGLLVSDYLAPGVVQLPSNNKAEIAQTDVMLTDGLMRYLRDLSEGRDLSALRSDGQHLFEQVIRSHDMRVAIGNLAPRNSQYLGLKRALGKMRRLDSNRSLVVINMERWRRDSMPTPHARDVLVNLPTFELRGRHQGKTVLDMPVVVGKQNRPTPLLKEDTIVDIKFSPDWGVPFTVEKEDIIPILQAKPELFEKMGLTAFRDGRQLDVMKVDWSRVNPARNNVYFRQPPGPENALGGARFSLTNPDDIFLHDSPERDKFGDRNRALSSGCVRVGRARDLALWLLSDQQGWTADRVQGLMTAGRTKVQKMRQPVPVSMTYYTAWVADNGSVSYGLDVYGRDAELKRKIDFGSLPQHPMVRAALPERPQDLAEELSP